VALLHALSQPAIATLTLVALLVALDLGYRLGARRRTEADDDAKSYFNGMQGSLIGLLALLLSFTFAMAVSRYDLRKDLVLQESNAIGTAALRARLLDEPQRAQVLASLREYVDARLAFYDAGVDRARLEQANAAAESLHQRLWSAAEAASARDPRSVPVGLFVQSLNDVIDLHEKRLRALENQVPGVVLLLVLGVAVLAFGFVGFGCGFAGRRHGVSTTLVAVLVTFVIVVILDLDRPREGLIKVSQRSMQALKQGIAESPR
jgi:hypothetical protein